VTGKTLKQWFAMLDGIDGVKQGRRQCVQMLCTEHQLDEWWAVTVAIEYERAKQVLEKDGRPKGYSICSTKTVAAPLERVYQAFGEAQILSRWLGTKAKADFHDGGRFETAEGDRGTFTRLRANKDLRIAWEHPELAPGTAVEVLLADKGQGKTGITLNHMRIQDRLAADRVRAAWSAAFDRLKTALEARA
jgi:uncharacterized protein YndB with AHSA1/START domain